jgi:F-type H+-transporting ATPase subunit gamma
MPSLRDIRRRIGSVRNTQQITKAMKMVAAAKLRRAQDAILRARPYAEKVDEVLAQVATRAAREAHPLLQKREPRHVELVLMTSDRGLCGGFNANILRRAQRFYNENRDRYARIEFSTIGRKGKEYSARRGIPSRKDYVGIFEDLRYERAKEIADELVAHYTTEKLDAVFLLYNEFKSAITQRVSLVQLLPIEPRAGVEEDALLPVDYLYEPSRTAVLESLLPRHLAMQVWRALLESQASEHGARMSAMDSASRNAADMIDRLTLYANRVRQAAITKELMEIVSGAEALKQ